MHLAAENGHAHVIEILADKFKASIFERTKDGSTLMHIASLNGHADCATMLFKKGVYLHMPNKDGARSIHTAAAYGHTGIINTLLQKGEKVDVTTNVGIVIINVIFGLTECFFLHNSKIIQRYISQWRHASRQLLKLFWDLVLMCTYVVENRMKRLCI